MKSPELGIGTEKGDKKGGVISLDSTLNEPDRGDTTHHLYPKNTPGHLHENVQNIGTQVTMVLALGKRSLGEKRKWAHSLAPPLSGPVGL